MLVDKKSNMASRHAGSKITARSYLRRMGVSSDSNRLRRLRRFCSMPKRPLVTEETKSKVVNQSSRDQPFVHLLSSSPASLGPWRVSYSRQNLHRNYASLCEQCTWYLFKPKILPKASISRKTAIFGP